MPRQRAGIRVLKACMKADTSQVWPSALQGTADIIADRVEPQDAEEAAGMPYDDLIGFQQFQRDQAPSTDLQST